MDEIIEKTANWLENISREDFNLIEAGKPDEANKLIATPENSYGKREVNRKITTRNFIVSTPVMRFGGMEQKIKGELRICLTQFTENKSSSTA